MFILKWLVFLTAGLAFQGLVYVVYPVVYAAWVLFIHKPITSKQKPKHQFNLTPGVGTATIFNGALLDGVDDHGAFAMYGFIQKEGLELLQEDGSLIRKRNADGSMNRNSVSGDTVVSWFFANELADRKASDSVIKSVADTYMKNLGTLSYDEFGQGYVSARCANFGVNIGAYDSDFLSLTQPATGPQYYTTAAVLAGAYNQGFKYKTLFWAHWVLMGGWYWAWAPTLYLKQDELVYPRDITMKALYVQLQVFGPRWWITKPMQFINDKITTHENDLWNAMMGREVGPLPEAMNSFFSQYADASSYENDRMSAHIPDAIRKIQRETKYK
jgi:hypothetical protein